MSAKERMVDAAASIALFSVLASFVAGIGFTADHIYKTVKAKKKEKQEQIAAFRSSIDFFVDSASSADDDSYRHNIYVFKGLAPKDRAVREYAVKRLRDASGLHRDSLGSSRINECLGDAYLKMIPYTEKENRVPLLTYTIEAYQMSMDMSYKGGADHQNFQYTCAEEKRDAAEAARDRILNPLEKRKDRTSVSAQDAWESLIKTIIPYESSHPR